jgi:uncharacterized protein (DUF2384 family)
MTQSKKIVKARTKGILKTSNKDKKSLESIKNEYTKLKRMSFNNYSEKLQSDNFLVIKELEENPGSEYVINEVQSITGMSLNQLATFVYEMTPKTLASYKNEGKHLPSRSLEISIKLKQLYIKAEELFLKSEHFNIWLQEECSGLGGRKPINLLNTSSGIDLVFEELSRIEFGATA